MTEVASGGRVFFYKKEMLSMSSTLYVGLLVNFSESAEFFAKRLMTYGLNNKQFIIRERLMVAFTLLYSRLLASSCTSYIW